MTAVVCDFAAKGHVLILLGGEQGQVAHSPVVPIWGLVTFNLAERPNRLPVSDPGKGDGRRVETHCMTIKLALSLQHHPLLRDQESGRS